MLEYSEGAREMVIYRAAKHLKTCIYLESQYLVLAVEPYVKMQLVDMSVKVAFALADIITFVAS